MKLILIIEDEEELLEEISDILKYEGYKTLKCNNGRKGIKIAKKSVPDLILCDILMKGMNGFEVLEILKKDSETQLIPFIFITAVDGNKNLRKGMDMGADDYLTKPFTRYNLLNAIKARFFKQNIINKNIKKVRDSIIYTIPHEFRTPLNIIMGFSDIIRKDADNMVAEDISMMGMSIYENSNKLYEIIKEYLTYIDTEINENSKLFCSVTDISGIIRTIVNNVASLHDRTGDCILKIENCEVDIIQEWFTFALKELVSNAFKFSEPGQIVNISSKVSDDCLKIVIKDKGRGFPPNSVKKINAFVQFDRHIYEQQGIGMGLFIAKRIIELHKGSLTIKSKPDKGSVVCLKIPRKIYKIGSN